MKRHYHNHALKRIVTSFVMLLHILGRAQLLYRHLNHNDLLVCILVLYIKFPLPTVATILFLHLEDQHTLFV